MIANLASTGWSETIDVTTLSDYEKQVHRGIWCSKMVHFTHDKLIKGYVDVNRDSKKSDINSMQILLRETGFYKQDRNDGEVQFKLSRDMKYEKYSSVLSVEVQSIIKLTYTVLYRYT